MLTKKSHRPLLHPLHLLHIGINGIDLGENRPLCSNVASVAPPYANIGREN